MLLAHRAVFGRRTFVHPETLKEMRRQDRVGERLECLKEKHRERQGWPGCGATGDRTHWWEALFQALWRAVGRDLSETDHKPSLRPRDCPPRSTAPGRMYTGHLETCPIVFGDALLIMGPNWKPNTRASQRPTWGAVARAGSCPAALGPAVLTSILG